MKIKILEKINAILPKQFYFNGKNILFLTITEDKKYKVYFSDIKGILPVSPPPSPPTDPDAPVPKVYNITTQPNSIDEGTSGIFVVTTANVPNQTVLYWTINNTQTNNSDFTYTNGSFLVNQNTGSFAVNINADTTTEGPETFTVSIRTGSSSGPVVATSNSITINDTSVTEEPPPPAATYTFTTQPSSINEGNFGLFVITTTNITNGTALYWTINHTGSTPTNNADFSPINGSFTISANTGSFTVSAVADQITEGPETFTVSIRTGSISGPIVVTSNSVTVNDTSVTPTPSVPQALIFYDGTTGEYTNYNNTGPGTGRNSNARLDAAGGQYMRSVGLADAGYELGSNVAGWTAGTPFYWVKTDEVRGMVKSFVAQGLTKTSKAYAYINWTEDNREFILIDGHTGPGTTFGGVFRSVADHDLLQKTMAKYLVGGTGVDGISFLGLKHYFPGVSFGFYNIPPWWKQDDVWAHTPQQIENYLELAANVVSGCNELMDAMDLLMPSNYSVVVNRDHMKIRSEQATKLCTKINNKLIAKGKKPKQIIPFVEPWFETRATCNPYNDYTTYSPSSCSYAKVIHGITLMRFRYTPPYTRMLETDLVYETYNPIISNGAHGASIWVSPSYRMKEIAGRTLASFGILEDEVISQPYIDGNGVRGWSSPCYKGVTGATAVWSYKDMWRQSIAADWSYRAGICLGITGNRWWWRHDQTSSGPYGACGPAEWFPLSGREGLTLGNQPPSFLGLSTKQTRDRLDDYIIETIEENIEIWKKTWNDIKTPLPAPSVSTTPSAPLILYDGSTGEYTSYTAAGPGTGKYPDARLDAAGGKYMGFVHLDTAYYEMRPIPAGWTAGTPFYWVKTDEVIGMVKNLVKQGLTLTSKAYAYINWTEDNREFILIDGHTGPGTTFGGVFRSVADHDLLQKTMAKYLVGGTGVDGISFLGLKHYFPGVSFGFYNIPPWWWGSNMWNGTPSQIENALEFAANVVSGCNELMDAVDLLMPSIYSVVNSRDFMKIQTEQATKLCTRINNKLVAKGKKPKQIIPFVQPYYETSQTGGPYTVASVATASNSYASVIHGITLIKYEYIPPHTRMLETDLVYQTYEPAILNGAHGGTIWMAPHYRMKQVAGREGFLPEDEVTSLPYIDTNGNRQWNAGWKRGVTGATAVWSFKDMWRQAMVADWSYRAGICLGITGNRWWWRHDQTPSGPYGACGPAEWFPLSGREGLTLGNTPVGATSTQQTRDKIDNYFMDVIKENIEIWSKTWNRINNPTTLTGPIIAAAWEGTNRLHQGGTTWDVADLIGLTYVYPMIWISNNQPYSINSGQAGRQTTVPIETPITIKNKITSLESTGISLNNRVFLLPGRYWYFDTFSGATSDNIPCGVTIAAATEVYYTPWADAGLMGVSAEWGNWVQGYKSIGGRLDYLILDYEGSGNPSFWDIKNWENFSPATGNANGRTRERWVKGLTSDWRFNNSWRGLTALGDLVSNIDLQFISCGDARCAGASFEYVKWNEAVYYYGEQTVNKALWNNTKSFYPASRGSNYKAFINTDTPAPDENGHPQSSISIFGTAAAPALYGELLSAYGGWWVDQDNPTRLIYFNSRGGGQPGPPKDASGIFYTNIEFPGLPKGDAYRLKNTAWGAFQLDHQRVRACKRSAPNIPLHVWISSYSFPTSNYSGTTNRPYFYENIRHAALMGTEVFLYWNNGAGTLGRLRMGQSKELDVILDEINFRLNYLPAAQPITLDPIKFTHMSAITADSSNVVISGARTANNTYLWRTTVAPGITLLRNNLNNQIVQLPVISSVVQPGFWETTLTSTPPSYSVIWS